MTAISDTHGRHRKLKLNGGDMLIHAGDIEAPSFHGLVDFILWFRDQDYKHKIFIAGNHDFFLQDSPDIVKKFSENNDIIYLQDEVVEIEGIQIWGSPWSLPFCDWAFMKPQEELDEIYKEIPEDIDILITHSPPHGTKRGIVKRPEGFDVGVKGLPHVPYTICGHIHEGYGSTHDVYLETCVFNCSVLDEKYNLVNDPITFEYG